MSSHEIVKVDRELALDSQIDLFKSKFNLPETMIETHAIVQKDGRYTLIKRPRPIKVFENDDGHVCSVNMTNRTGGEKMRLGVCRGKYNDAGRLMDQDAASIDWREVSPFNTL